MHLEAVNPIVERGIVGIDSVEAAKKSLSMIYSDGSKGTAPYLWLRDNCQCESCFDAVAQGRKSLLQDVDGNVKPIKVELIQGGDGLRVDWNDGHSSEFDASWCHERSFNSEAKQNYRDFHQIPRESWGSNLNLDTFDYTKVKTNDHHLLSFLTTLEKKGVALIKAAKDDPDAGAQLIDHIAFVKQCHYG